MRVDVHPPLSPRAPVAQLAPRRRRQGIEHCQRPFEIAVRRLFGGGGHTPVTFAFDAPSDGPVTRVHRQIALGDVPRGRYVLSVRITDPATGVTLTQQRRFEVLSRESVDRRAGLP